VDRLSEMARFVDISIDASGSSPPRRRRGATKPCARSPCCRVEWRGLLRTRRSRV